jgi:hypothetical protein
MKEMGDAKTITLRAALRGPSAPAWKIHFAPGDGCAAASPACQH